MFVANVWDMTLLIDTNVILDYMLGDGDLDNITEVIRSIERKEFIGCITASAVTDIHHILVRRLLKVYKEQKGSLSHRKAEQEIREKVMNDLEEFLSVNNGVAHIITRNVKDFEQPGIPVSTPEQFLREAK